MPENIFELNEKEINNLVKNIASDVLELRGCKLKVQEADTINLNAYIEMSDVLQNGSSIDKAVTSLDDGITNSLDAITDSVSALSNLDKEIQNIIDEGNKQETRDNNSRQRKNMGSF